MTCLPGLLRGLAMAAVLVSALEVYGADEAAPVPRPDVKVGDSWTYVFTNLAANVPKPSRGESRVTFVSSDVIVTVNRSESGTESDSQFTAEWNPIALAESISTPLQRHYKFPLKIGETYPYAYEQAFRASPVRIRAEGMFKVVGWDDVVVPAGKFRALKLEGRGNYQRLDTRYGAPQRWDIWYVPEVRRMVKSLYEDGPPGGNPDTKRLFELMDFRLQ